jgi:AraC family transcriptional regulator
MADFDARPLLMTETASVWDVACPGACKHRSDEEYVAATHLVFPYRGVYVHHVGRAETVAEANQAVILNENEPYRVSTLSRVVMPAFRSPPVMRFCSRWRLNTIS